MMRKLPDIPRCTITTSPPSVSSSRYFDLRFTETNVRPAISASSGETGQRRSYRRMITSEIFFPITCGEMPNLVVSTSGSSGIEINFKFQVSAASPFSKSCSTRFTPNLSSYSIRLTFDI